MDYARDCVDEPRAPFPWFGGKRRTAPIVWAALGDVPNYVEPFAGSLGVLLARPRADGPRVETVNDLDGWLVNFWRAVRLKPAEVARHCADPVSEIDLHARLAWLQERRGPEIVSWLEGDPEACDAKAAGWWVYVVCASIGNAFDAGPWRVIDGRLVDTRKLPHLGNAGRGVNRELPHLGDAGQAPLSREESIAQYMAALARRLEGVRITCGDWRRVLKPSVLGSGEPCGVFLDPPYETSSDLYNTDGNAAVSAQVREWCAEHSGDGLRIALCGYLDEHDELLRHGWRRVDGKAGGSGYKGAAGDADAHRRERVWLSPDCLDDSQMKLF